MTIILEVEDSDETTNIAISEFTKKYLVEQLTNNIVTVNFTKVNGDERNMKCTLRSSFLPDRTENKKTTRKPNENLLSVWDIDNNGWRSFKVDSVNNIILNGKG